jgi:hypothetical protein
MPAARGRIYVPEHAVEPSSPDDGSAVITITIGSPGSMGRPQAMHSNIDILSVVRQHARQIGGAQGYGDDVGWTWTPQASQARPNRYPPVGVFDGQG